MQSYNFLGINPKKVYYQRRRNLHVPIQINNHVPVNMKSFNHQSMPNNISTIINNINSTKSNSKNYIPKIKYNGILDSFVSHNIKSTQNKYLGLLTRCKDEFYVREFVEYYLSQGIDKIYIIDDNSEDKSIYKEFIENPKVCIIFEKNIINQNITLKIYQRIRGEFQWLIYCDIDEFITTKKNINKTLRDEIHDSFDNTQIKCICIPWVMMSCNGKVKNPTYITQEITHRWNHNLKHPHPISKFRCLYDSIEIKSIFRPKYYEFCPGKKAPWGGNFNIQNDHIPSSLRNYKNDKWNSINIKPINSWRFIGLREKHIEIAYFVCFHYRVISHENNINKISTNTWYKKYRVKDLDDYDYPEIVDFTVRDKMSYLYKIL